jgi:hypothetical protein
LSFPHEQWRLYPGGAPSHALIANQKLEDGSLWWFHEFARTLIGPDVARGKIRFSSGALEGFREFRNLYPEWPRAPYMSTDMATRKRRLAVIFGDLPLSVEPRGEEIPPDLYRRLALSKILGGPAAIRGVNADLILLKLPHLLPLEVRKKLVLDYLSLLYKDDDADSQIRTQGRGGIAARRQHELIMLGRYRLLEANQFDMRKTMMEAYRDWKRSDRSFVESRAFVESLWPKRWALFEPYLALNNI